MPQPTIQSEHVTEVKILGTIAGSGLRVESGSVRAGAGDAGWSLSDNAPPSERRFPVFVPFEKDFTEAPIVLVNLAGFDIIQGSNHRLRVESPIVKSKASGVFHGFELTFVTWWDTSVFAAWATYLVIGKKS